LALTHQCAFAEAFDKTATTDQQEITFAALNALGIARKRIPLPDDKYSPGYSFQVMMTAIFDP
jgi:hypothetical protein